MSTDDQQPQRPEAKAESAEDGHPTGDERPRAAAGTAPERLESDRERTRAFRRLPAEEQGRRIREQFEDPAWRERDVLVWLRRTVDEDPVGISFPDLGAGRAARGRGLWRAWRHAQEALDATALGEVSRPSIELLPAGGAFRVGLRMPELGVTVRVSGRGSRTAAGAMRRLERAMVRMVVAEGAAVLADESARTAESDRQP